MTVRLIWAGNGLHRRVSNKFPQGLMAITNIITFCFLCQAQFLELVILDTKRALIVPAKTHGPSLEKKARKTNYMWQMLVMLLIALLAQSPPVAPILMSRIWGWVRHTTHVFMDDLSIHRTWWEFHDVPTCFCFPLCNKMSVNPRQGPLSLRQGCWIEKHSMPKGNRVYGNLKWFDRTK